MSTFLESLTQMGENLLSSCGIPCTKFEWFELRICQLRRFLSDGGGRGERIVWALFYRRLIQLVFHIY